MAINAVIEGCNGEDRTLNYLGYELFIPENAVAIKIGERNHLFLSGLDFHLFHLQSINRNPRGGYPIDPPGLKFGLTVSRSLITNDGRIYVSSDAIENHLYYLDYYIPIIVKDCQIIFNNGIKPESLSRDLE
jgi:hypothetical protein